MTSPRGAATPGAPGLRGLLRAAAGSNVAIAGVPGTGPAAPLDPHRRTGAPTMTLTTSTGYEISNIRRIPGVGSTPPPRPVGRLELDPRRQHHHPARGSPPNDRWWLLTSTDGVTVLGEFGDQAFPVDYQTESMACASLLSYHLALGIGDAR